MSVVHMDNNDEYDENRSTSNNKTSYNDPVALLRCGQCGVLVPRMNWQIHQIHACTTTVHNDDSTKESPPTLLPTTAAVVVASGTMRARREPQESQPSLKDEDDRKRPARHHPSSRPEETNFVDLMDVDDDDDFGMDDDDSIVEIIGPPAAARATAAAAAAGVDTTLREEEHSDTTNVRSIWACPRCTLHNPIHVRCCHACGHQHQHQQPQQQQQQPQPHSDFVRSPDPVRRGERLIDDDDWLSSYANAGNSTNASSSSSSSPLLSSYLSGGALLGGVIGATGAYLQGRPVASSAVNGMVGGAVSGAILSELWGSSPPPRQSPPSSAAAAARVRHPYAQQQQQRRRTTETTLATNARVRRRRARGGSRRRYYTTTGTLAHRSSDNYEDSDDDNDTDPLLLEFLLRSGSGLRHLHYTHSGGLGPTNRGHHHIDVDRMSYEQLLARFGDGSDHWGADPRDVARLPVTTLHQPDTELPEEGRDCGICLEPFVPNDQRKVLPCWHGYHAHCIDQWLPTNGSCPICKHKISSNSTPST